MLRNLIFLLLTLFQDKYVRTGTLVGILIGIWNPEILQGEQGKIVMILGFVGWGIGAFLGYYKNGNSQFTKKKEIQSLPGRQVIPAENLQPFPAAPPVTISGFFTFLHFL